MTPVVTYSNYWSYKAERELSSYCIIGRPIILLLTVHHFKTVSKPASIQVPLVFTKLINFSTNRTV